MFQLITDPPILICDEPTSGLDSYTAASVVTLLRQLAARGNFSKIMSDLFINPDDNNFVH